MLWYTTRLISVLTSVMEYVYFVCPSFKTKKTACPNGPFIPAIKTGGLDFLIAYAMLILRHAFRDNCYLCDYFACCDEEEQLCLKEYEYKRRKSNIADSAFVHIDIPLTFEHQCDLLRNAGFINIRILHQNDSTVIIRAEKRIDNIE